MRIRAALEHIGAHGNLHGLPAARSERLALVSTATRQGLVVWNRRRKRYELTSRGRRHVRAVPRSDRIAVRDGQRSGLGAAINAVTAAVGAVAAIAAVLVAAFAISPGVPVRHPDAGLTIGSITPARTQVVQGAQPTGVAGPKMAAGGIASTPEQRPAEPIAAAPESARADAPAPNANREPGEAARSLAAAPSEPEVATPAGGKATAREARGPAEVKPVRKHKRTARRHQAVQPGYAYAPNPGFQTYQYRSAQSWPTQPWWFR